jgi:hypothetical protein
MEATHTDLSQYCLASQAQVDLENLFPSKHSFNWFVRRNKTDLARSGAMILVAGRKLFHKEKLAKAILVRGIRDAIGEVQNG